MGDDNTFQGKQFPLKISTSQSAYSAKISAYLPSSCHLFNFKKTYFKIEILFDEWKQVDCKWLPGKKRSYLFYEAFISFDPSQTWTSVHKINYSKEGVKILSIELLNPVKYDHVTRID